MAVAIAWRRLGAERRRLVEVEIERATSALAAMGARRVVLFGSHARGDASDASDVDLLVVIPWDPGAPVGARAAEIARRIVPRIGLDLVVYTPEEFAALRDRAPLPLAALREGKVLL